MTESVKMNSGPESNLEKFGKTLSNSLKIALLAGTLLNSTDTEARMVNIESNVNNFSVAGVAVEVTNSKATFGDNWYTIRYTNPETGTTKEETVQIDREQITELGELEALSAVAKAKIEAEISGKPNFEVKNTLSSDTVAKLNAEGFNLTTEEISLPSLGTFSIDTDTRGISLSEMTRSDSPNTYIKISIYNYDGSYQGVDCTYFAEESRTFCHVTDY